MIIRTILFSLIKKFRAQEQAQQRLECLTDETRKIKNE
jgi:hypothetical protein